MTGLAMLHGGRILAHRESCALSTNSAFDFRKVCWEVRCIESCNFRRHRPETGGRVGNSLAQEERENSREERNSRAACQRATIPEILHIPRTNRNVHLCARHFFNQCCQVIGAMLAIAIHATDNLILLPHGELVAALYGAANAKIAGESQHKGACLLSALGRSILRPIVYYEDVGSVQNASYVGNNC